MAVARRRKPEPAAAPSAPGTDWGTPAARVRWLLITRFKENRSAFAAAVGVSHTAINLVAAGRRQPGRKLLAAIARELRVDPGWLLAGKGQPFADAAGLAGAGVPIASTPLPGPPQEYQSLLSGYWSPDAGNLFTPTQYWLRLTSADPVTRCPHFGFRPGDHLLMETDRSRFPRPEHLYEALCIVRHPAGGLKLETVSYREDCDVPDSGSLELETFVDEPDPSGVVHEVVYWHFPNGEIKSTERKLRLPKSRGAGRPVPVANWGQTPAPRIEYTDIAGVWLRMLRRTGP